MVPQLGHITPTVVPDATSGIDVTGLLDGLGDIDLNALFQFANNSITTPTTTSVTLSDPITTTTTLPAFDPSSLINQFSQLSSQLFQQPPVQQWQMPMMPQNQWFFGSVPWVQGATNDDMAGQQTLQQVYSAFQQYGMNQLIDQWFGWQNQTNGWSTPWQIRPSIPVFDSQPYQVNPAMGYGYGNPMMMANNNYNYGNQMAMNGYGGGYGNQMGMGGYSGYGNMMGGGWV